MGVRLNKVLTELNIGLQMAVDYLKQENIGEIKDDATINTKITDDQYEALVSHFSGDRGLKKQWNRISPKKFNPGGKYAGMEREPKGPRPQYTPLGKIDIAGIGKKKTETEPKNEVVSETMHQEYLTQTKDNYFAFISYSRKDLKVATAIKKEIESICKYECWMDLEGIESGDQFEDVIISAIDNSKIVIFLMSSNSMASVYSKKEVRYADSIKKKIVPVSIDNSKPSGWFLFNFGGTDVIDYNNVEQKKKLFTNLAEWSKSLKSKKSEKLPLIFTKGNDNLPVIHLFLLIDTSGSMYGERIEATNIAFSNVLSSFEILNPDIEIRIAVLEFNSSVRWMHETPQPLDSFVWMPLEPGGLTQMGEALSTLNNKMQHTGYFNSNLCKGSIIPSLIILLTDGEPTDDYSKGLKEISDNPYFKKATKFAIGIGDDFSIKPLVDFTGNHKTVFQIKDENASSDLTSLLTRLITMGLYAGSVSSLNND